SPTVHESRGRVFSCRHRSHSAPSAALNGQSHLVAQRIVISPGPVQGLPVHTVARRDDKLTLLSLWINRSSAQASRWPTSAPFSKKAGLFLNEGRFAGRAAQSRRPPRVIADLWRTSC